MIKHHNDHILTTFTAVLAVTLVTPEAYAQSYFTYPTQQTYYQQPQQTYAQDHANRSRGYRFSRLPVVGRTTAGGGWSHGRLNGYGFNFEGAFSFRLQSNATYRGGHILIIPEVGYSVIAHYRNVEHEQEFENHEFMALNPEELTYTEREDHQLFQLAMAGLRVGWGRPRIGNIYAVGRVLAGFRDSSSNAWGERVYENGLAFGLQYGVGAELWHGILGVDITHFWLYSQGAGNLQGIRISVNFDVSRALTTLVAIVMNQGTEFLRDDRDS